MALVIGINVLMIRQVRHRKLGDLRRWQTPLTLTGWLLAFAGLLIGCTKAFQVKQVKTHSCHNSSLKGNCLFSLSNGQQLEWGQTNWHYIGEAAMWLGLSLSAISANDKMTTRYWPIVLAIPLCYFVPYVSFI